MAQNRNGKTKKKKELSVKEIAIQEKINDYKFEIMNKNMKDMEKDLRKYFEIKLTKERGNKEQKVASVENNEEVNYVGQHRGGDFRKAVRFDEQQGHQYQHRQKFHQAPEYMINTFQQPAYGQQPTSPRQQKQQYHAFQQVQAPPPPKPSLEEMMIKLQQQTLDLQWATQASLGVLEKQIGQLAEQGQ